MGIITHNGIIGIIKSTSDNYSKAISILNSKSSISIKHVKSNQNGSLKWKKNNYMELKLTTYLITLKFISEIPYRQMDTVSIFPKNINIGTITNYKKGSENGLYNIKVRFINDMNSITNVYIINSLYKKEIEDL